MGATRYRCIYTVLDCSGLSVSIRTFIISNKIRSIINLQWEIGHKLRKDSRSYMTYLHYNVNTLDFIHKISV